MRKIITKISERGKYFHIVLRIILLYFFNAMNTGWNVAVLSLYAIDFPFFLLKIKEFCLKKM